MFILSKFNSIANQFLAEIRAIGIQTDQMRFRRNMERLGELLAYEMSKSLDFEEKKVQTPLGTIILQVPDKSPILISILRAGIPLHQGVLNYFDKADNGFLGAYRKHKYNEKDFVIAMDYVSAPSVEGRHVVLIDPMLATGKSLVRACEAIYQHGFPKHIHFISAIAAPEGVAYIQENIKTDHSFWLGAVDEGLDENYYIIPGLGDAGDLSFGLKL